MTNDQINPDDAVDIRDLGKQIIYETDTMSAIGILVSIYKSRRSCQITSLSGDHVQMVPLDQVRLASQEDSPLHDIADHLEVIASALAYLATNIPKKPPEESDEDDGDPKPNKSFFFSGR